MASRFAQTPSISEFIEQQENKNKRRKTLQDIELLQEFLSSRNESRKVEDISVEQLNEYLSEFIISVRKKEDNGEYEPSSLRSMFASFERYLKKKNGISIIMDKALNVHGKLFNRNKKSSSKKEKGLTNPMLALLLAKMKPNCSTKKNFWELQIAKLC